jgi:act minimal PKS ketosynthase (KS/KS alpha)
MSERKIVVTGMGAISPAGIGVPALWQAARDGRTCGSRITRFDVSQSVSQIAAEAHGFHPAAAGIDAQDATRMDRVTQFSVAASREAMRDAGLDGGGFEPERTGVCIGTAIGGVAFMERVFNQVCLRNGGGKPSAVELMTDGADPHLYGGFLAHSVSSEVALAHGLKGVCTTMATGCTAGADAIGTASDMITAGLADIMITGASEAPLTPIVVTAFDNISCLTRRNDQPVRASRPFDRERDGFLLAEGCGLLVLEEEEHARARGANIYGRVIGYASLSNAYHMTGLPSDGDALARTLRRVLANARINADEVDYINAHGSSTQQNDLNETSAFKTVFGERAYRIPISSTKSVLGHALGAASALESIVCLCAIRESVIPPTANYENPDPNCDLDYVPNEPREGRLRVVECNASGFSGIHSSILYASPDFQAAAV